MLYTGSLTNTAEYKSAGDMKSYVSSMISMAAVQEDDNAPVKPDESCLLAVKRAVSGMFDFSLLRTVAFVPILASGVVGFFGLLITIATSGFRYCVNHRLNGSLSPVLTATSFSYGETKNSTPTESEPLTRLR